MRKARDFQASLNHPWLELDHAKELQALAGLIDQHPKIADLVWQDLTGDQCKATGARGTSADLVFRALLIKQMHSWSYEELHFHLSDSRTYRTFCQIPLGHKAPARSTLAAAIKKIRPETLRTIHRILVADAADRVGASEDALRGARLVDLLGDERRGEPVVLQRRVVLFLIAHRDTSPAGADRGRSSR